MSTAKELIIDRVNNMSDDMDENQMIDRLYMLSRLEHSRKRCQEEGTIKDSELDEHFKEENLYQILSQKKKELTRYFDKVKT